MSFKTDMGIIDADILQHLGDAVVYVPVAGDPVELQGLFDEAYAKVTQQGDNYISSNSPGVLVLRADLDFDEVTTEGDAMTIDGQTYYICGIEKHGKLAMLWLSEDENS